MKCNLFYNGKIYTQAGDFIIADSMAVNGNIVIAVGKNLQKDPDFNSYNHIDLKGHAVLPGLVDAHTHFYFMVISYGNVKLDGLTSIEDVLRKIKKHAARLGKSEWVIGEGFSPDRWRKYVLPDKYMLDKITGGRPAAIFSKDTHLMWVNSKALELAGINRTTPEPRGGAIGRLDNNEPSGILKEIPGYFPVFKLIGRPSKNKVQRLYKTAVQEMYSRGVTGVHSFDGPEAFPFFVEMAEKNKLGLRINYYPPNKMLPHLTRGQVAHNYGNDYLKISGIKMFADGALGSQTALCFQKYIGSRGNYGIEVTPKDEMTKMIKQAARLGLPCAIHAIGDKAIANVLDCLEKTPRPKPGVRHRIEHLQMIHPSDIKRLKRLKIIGSVQPSHCPSDIKMINKYWGNRGRNCFVFRKLMKDNIPLAFGSDAPIEPLDPIAGIDAAVNRFAPGIGKSFYPDERISVAEAVFNYTVGPAYAVGQENQHGYLLPGFKADFIILCDNVYKIPRRRIREVDVLATFFDGRLVFKHKNCKLIM